MTSHTNVRLLLDRVVGTRRASRLERAIHVPAGLAPGALVADGTPATIGSAPNGSEDGDRVSRAELAMALAMLLVEDLMYRVPMARAYIVDSVRKGERLCFDHGALRTVATDLGALPGGEAAFARILEPLGYSRRETYPLDRLSMTGRAWTHDDLPEDVPQYFVSELHPERFSEDFQAAVQRVVGNSADPLPASALELLQELGEQRWLPFEKAAALLPNLTACFDRQHDWPTLADYEILLAESAEMAWIATEGNAFNHATDRVEDVRAIAEEQRKLGRPMKETVEVSTSGRVLQTAFRAAQVERLFVSDAGHLVPRTVPGSFHEFITRLHKDDGTLDLAFDAANAQGIFKMTAGAGSES